jgi:hypothetical protein
MMTNHQAEREASSTDRSVSDIIGFTIMFSIILLGAGAISITGGSQIADLSEAEEVRSAERGMQSVAATLQPMVSDGDPRRSFSIAFSNSNVLVNESTLNITTDDGSDINNIVRQINSLEQSFDRSNGDITVRYEGGGVFRSNAISAYEPEFQCTERNGETTAIISVVNLTLVEKGGFSVTQGNANDLRYEDFTGQEEIPITSSDAALNFRATLVDSERNISTSPQTIYVNASQTAGPEQWEQFLNVTSDGNWEPTSEDYVYECDTDQSIVRVVTIEIEPVQPRFSD